MLAWRAVASDVLKYARSHEGTRHVNKSVPTAFFAEWDNFAGRSQHADVGVWRFDNGKWLLHKRMDAKVE